MGFVWGGYWTRDSGLRMGGQDTYNKTRMTYVGVLRRFKEKTRGDCAGIFELLNWTPCSIGLQYTGLDRMKAS